MDEINQNAQASTLPFAVQQRQHHFDFQRAKIVGRNVSFISNSPKSPGLNSNMPPYVRKAPLAERIRSAIDIYDWNLWLREEIESRGWDKLEQGWALPVGIVLNLIFLIARANVDRRSKGYDDVFGESMSSGWGAAVVCGPFSASHS